MDIFPYDAVVFDLDGTLFDAEEGIVSSVRRAMDEMGLEVPADADLREVVGPPLADSFRDLLGVPEARVQEAVDRYRRDFSARGMYLYSVYPNIRSILRMLHEAGVHVGLATLQAASAGEGHPVLLRAGTRYLRVARRTRRPSWARPS